MSSNSDIISWIYTTIFDMMSIFGIVLELTWCQFFALSEWKLFSRGKKLTPSAEIDIMLAFCWKKFKGGQKTIGHCFYCFLKILGGQTSFSGGRKKSFGRCPPPCSRKPACYLFKRMQKFEDVINFLSSSSKSNRFTLMWSKNWHHVKKLTSCQKLQCKSSC